MPQKYVTQNNKKSFLWSSLPSLLLLVLILGGFFLFAISLRRNQDLRQQASETTNKVVLSLKANAPDDEHLKIDVFINTQGNRIAAFDLKGTVSETTSDNVKIENTDSLSLNSLQDKLSQDNQKTNFRVVKFAQPDPNAQTSTHGQEVRLFSIVITKPKDKKATITLSAADSSLSYINANGIETQFPATQTFLLRTAADRGEKEVVCNKYCADNTECSTGYTCYGNRCRNPKNVKSTTCAKPAVVKTATTSAVSTTPTPSPSPSPTALPADAVVLAIDGIPLTSPSPTPSPISSPSPTPSPRVISTPSPIVQPVVEAPQPSRLPAILLIVAIAVIGFGALFFAYKKFYQ